MKKNIMKNIHIAYGSQSGNAHSLAYQLKLKCLGLGASFSELNDLDISRLTKNDVLLVVTSTTGDGEAPSNANTFYQTLARSLHDKNRVKSEFEFAVFGIGDVNYDNFCGFSIVVDGLLRRIGATAIAERVDADIDFEDDFEHWASAVLESIVHG